MKSNYLLIIDPDNNEFTEISKNNLITLLQNIDTKRETIMNIMGFCLDHHYHSEEILDVFMKKIFSSSAKRVGFPQKLACIYVFNDLLNNKSFSENYLNLLGDRMIGILQSTVESSNKDDSTKEQVRVVLKLWKEKSFFSDTKIQGWIDMLS